MWKKGSDWRKSKAQQLRANRNMLRYGFPLESEWNGRKRAEVK